MFFLMAINLKKSMILSYSDGITDYDLFMAKNGKIEIINDK